MSILFFLILAIKPEGFFEYQGEIFNLKGEYKFVGYSKLNLTSRQRISSSYFRTDLVYISYHGKTQYDLTDFMPEYALPSIPFTYKSRLYFRNAFLRVRISPLTLQFGRQQIGWGTGYAFNPTNVFQKKSILDPSYELDGVDALRMFLDIAGSFDVDLLYIPENSIDSSSYGGRLRGNVKGFLDFSLGYLDYLSTYMDPVIFLPFKKKNKIFTLDFSTEFLGIGVHGEGTYNLKTKKKIGLLGIDYTFNDGLTSCLLEYLRNEEGKDDFKDYNPADWLNYLSGYTLSMGKNEIFFNLERIHELFTFRLSSIFNVNDKSAIIMPGVRYSFNDYTSLQIIGYLGVGEENTEYSKTNNGVAFRIRTGF